MVNVANTSTDGDKLGDDMESQLNSEKEMKKSFNLSKFMISLLVISTIGLLVWNITIQNKLSEVSDRLEKIKVAGMNTALQMVLVKQALFPDIPVTKEPEPEIDQNGFTFDEYFEEIK